MSLLSWAESKILYTCVYLQCASPTALAASMCTHRVCVARQPGETSVAHFLVPCCCARHSSVEGIWTCHSVTPAPLSASTQPLLPSAFLSADPAWPASPDSRIKTYSAPIGNEEAPHVTKLGFWDPHADQTEHRGGKLATLIREDEIFSL